MCKVSFTRVRGGQYCQPPRTHVNDPFTHPQSIIYISVLCKKNLLQAMYDPTIPKESSFSSDGSICSKVYLPYHISVRSCRQGLCVSLWPATSHQCGLVGRDVCVCVSLTGDQPSVQSCRQGLCVCVSLSDQRPAICAVL